MNKQELAAMVAEILSGMEHEPPVKGGDYHPTAPQPEKAPTPYRDGDFVPDVTALDLRKLYLVEHAENEEKFRKMKEKTPARLGSGRAGARYKTLTMLRFRADHAAAQDAVFSQVSEDFAAKNGMVEVRTKCRDKDEYLTRPDLGRCFDEENQQKIRAAVPGTPRVQIVVGDGLSSAAITANAMDCLAAIRDGLKLRGIDPGNADFRPLLPRGRGGRHRRRDGVRAGVYAGGRAAGSGDGQEHVRLYHLPVPGPAFPNPPGRWCPTFTPRAPRRWRPGRTSQG